MEKSQFVYRGDGQGGPRSCKARINLWIDLFQMFVLVEGFGASEDEAKADINRSLLKLKAKVEELVQTIQEKTED